MKSPAHCGFSKGWHEVQVVAACASSRAACALTRFGARGRGLAAPSRLWLRRCAFTGRDCAGGTIDAEATAKKRAPQRQAVLAKAEVGYGSLQCGGDQIRAREHAVRMFVRVVVLYIWAPSVDACATARVSPCALSVCRVSERLLTDAMHPRYRA